MSLEKTPQHSFFPWESRNYKSPHCLDHCLLTIYGNNERLCKWGIPRAGKPLSGRQGMVHLHRDIAIYFPSYLCPVGSEFLAMHMKTLGMHSQISQFVWEKLWCSFAIRFWQTLGRECLYKKSAELFIWQSFSVCKLVFPVFSFP